MDALKGKSAVVLGAGSGVGRATVLAFASHGMRVWGVARTKERIDRIVREAPGTVSAMVLDATDPKAIAKVFAETDPDVVVVAVGARPRMAPVDEQTWESFSEVWNNDVRASFNVSQAAVRHPMRPGGVVISLSSGAAIAGSPLSGGYAGAKRMQWFLGGYMQRLSADRKLGLRFATILPKQLIVGTTIGEAASSAYSNAAGITLEKYMERFGAPLMPEGVADVIVKVSTGEVAPEGGAFAVTGKGIEALG